MAPVLASDSQPAFHLHLTRDDQPVSLIDAIRAVAAGESPEDYVGTLNAVLGEADGTTGSQEDALPQARGAFVVSEPEQRW